MDLLTTNKQDSGMAANVQYGREQRTMQQIVNQESRQGRNDW